MIYDLIIVGMGPAGMGAAIYAQRSGLNVLVLEKDIPGGLLNKTSNVDNYLGFDDVMGPDLAVEMFKHFKDANIPYKFDGATKVTVDGDIKTVITEKETYQSYAVIIATGRKNKRLKIDNAIDLEGKGISYCALCDAQLYRHKNVAILGAGNSAFEEGTYLSKICNKVYIINKFDMFTADDVLVEEMMSLNNVEVINNVQIVKLNKDENGFLSSILLTNDQLIDVSGLFVYIGYEQASEIVADLGITNDFGYIKVDANQETTIKGLYACGDITQKKVYQIITAVSEGAVAAISANKHIDSIKRSKK